jgi:hypothetical protein
MDPDRQFALEVCLSASSLYNFASPLPCVLADDTQDGPSSLCPATSSTILTSTKHSLFSSILVCKILSPLPQAPFYNLKYDQEAKSCPLKEDG